jgi:phosphatidate cytidylyltransferase
LARKQPPPGFDPHPGDPWHPDWSLSDESRREEPEIVDPDALVVEQGGDADWWQRALARQDDTGEPAQVPEAYASLEAAVAEEPDLASDTSEPAEPVRGPWWRRRPRRASNADTPEDQSEAPVAGEPDPELELQAAAQAEAEAVLAEAEAEGRSEAVTGSEAEGVSEPISELDSAAVPVLESDVEDMAEPVPELEPEVAGLVEHLVEDLTLEAEVVEGSRPDVDVQLVAESESEVSLDAEPAVVPEDAVIQDLLSKWGSEPAVVEDAGTDSGHDLAAEPAHHPNLDLRPETAPELAALVEEVVADLERDAEVADDGVAEVVEADGEPGAEFEPEPDEEVLATKAADRVYRIARSIAAEDSLQAADSSHQEDARMRAAIAEVREKHEVHPENADDLEARQAERMAVREALAAEVRRIEAARQEVEESVRRTAAEVSSALEGHRQSTEESSRTLHRPINDIGATFAAIAADQKAYDDVDLQRMERREQLRLRTSLLVVDADQPWAAQGWTRPGSSLGSAPPAGRMRQPGAAAPVVASFEPIDTASASTVPESAPRRRWSWSRKRNPPTSPNTPQDTMRHVVVVKEQSVSGREGESGEDGQDALPFDDAASPAPETNGDLDDLAAWSDMDWDFDTSPTTPADESPTGLNSPDPGLSSDDSVDGSSDIESVDTASPDMDSPDTWESFTADDYVQTATHEYADLAAAVAAAETEEPEQAALSADMPGLESSLVSLDDVVAAQGMERAAAAPDRSDLALRVLTAIGLIALFVASLTYRWSIRLLVLLVMMVAAGELATSLTRRGQHPVGLFSYLGTAGALVGTWVYGPVAIPVAVAVTLLVVVLFFGLVTGRQDPLVGMALTVVTVMWVGVFGAFAYDLIEASEYRWLIAALVIIVAGMDVASYFIGKRFGKRLLAPVVSPKKTVAGLVGGVIAAVGIGYGISFIPAAPFEWQEGLVLGAALAVTGPLGDLAVSVLKRAMQVKDMGTILPGHGGVVDRIDAILFSIPAAWAVYAWAGLLV